MNITCNPSAYFGKIQAPPSKSAAHRLLIAAALAENSTRISIDVLSEDLLATIACLRAMGAKIVRGAEGITVTPICANPNPCPAPALDAGESGTTLRFLLPVAAASFDQFTITGRGRLPERPIGPLMDEMRRHGASFSGVKLPFTVSGRLTGGKFVLPGNISSQFVSGLLFALPAIGGEIALSTHLESAGYVEMTLETLWQFGIGVQKTPTGFLCPAGVYHSPGSVAPEGDYSNAAFFLAAGALSGRAAVTGLVENSLQGDCEILQLLASFGARVETDRGCVTVYKGDLCAQTIDVSDIPDLLPVLSVLGARAKGVTRLVNAGRLRLKESDRIHSSRAMLTALGVDAWDDEDALFIRGGTIKGGTVDACGDHRIAMAAAAASCASENPVTIFGAEAVNKSFPDFFKRFQERSDG